MHPDNFTHIMATWNVLGFGLAQLTYSVVDSMYMVVWYIAGNNEFTVFYTDNEQDAIDEYYKATLVLG